MSEEETDVEEAEDESYSDEPITLEVQDGVVGGSSAFTEGD